MATNNKHLQRLFTLDPQLYHDSESISNTVNDILLAIEDGEGASEDSWATLLGHVAILRSHLDAIERSALKSMARKDLTWETPNG